MRNPLMTMCGHHDQIDLVFLRKIVNRHDGMAHLDRSYDGVVDGSDPLIWKGECQLQFRLLHQPGQNVIRNRPRIPRSMHWQGGIFDRMEHIECCLELLGERQGIVLGLAGSRTKVGGKQNPTNREIHDAGSTFGRVLLGRAL